MFCFHLKKSAAESYRLLPEASSEHAPSQDDFGISKVKRQDKEEDKEHGKLPKNGRCGDRPRRTIHIVDKTESFWQKNDDLSSGGPEVRGLYELLKTRETVNIKRYQQQLADLNRSLLEERPEY